MPSHSSLPSCVQGCSCWGLGTQLLPCHLRETPGNSLSLLLVTKCLSLSVGPRHPACLSLVSSLNAFQENPLGRQDPDCHSQETHGAYLGKGVGRGDPGRAGSLEASGGQDLYLIRKVRRAFEVIIFLFSFPFSTSLGREELSVKGSMWHNL